jgi:hypothetical protein
VLGRGSSEALLVENVIRSVMGCQRMTATREADDQAVIKGRAERQSRKAGRHVDKLRAICSTVIAHGSFPIIEVCEREQ